MIKWIYGYSSDGVMTGYRAKASSSLRRFPSSPKASKSKQNYPSTRLTIVAGSKMYPSITATARLDWSPNSIP